MIPHSILPLLPELILFIGAIILLLLTAFIKQEALRIVTTCSITILLTALSAAILEEPTKNLLLFNQVVNDAFARLAKIMILTITTLVAICNRDFLKKEGIEAPEYSVLILLSVLGMMIMVSAQSFISLFMGLEIQSLSLYLIATLRRNEGRASEAGLKYFLLGSFATGMTLYGISFIYGSTGHIGFSEIKAFLHSSGSIPLSFYLGMAFILAGVVFKIAVVPFHMWVPDVYEGVPTLVVTFFSCVPKVASFCMITRLLAEPFLALHDQWQYVIGSLAVATMIVGGFGALYQKNIKRLLAYSSILNMGYSLLGLLSGDIYDIESSLIYISLYAMTVLGFFVCLLIIRRQEVHNVVDLSGLFRIYPGISIIMVFLLLSFAGVPPLAGFLGKLYVFESVLHADMLPIAMIGVFMSVIAAGYYLYVIKVIMLDEPQKTKRSLGINREIQEKGSLCVISLIVGTLLCFFIKPEFFLKFFIVASKALSPS